MGPSFWVVVEEAEAEAEAETATAMTRGLALLLLLLLLLLSPLLSSSPAAAPAVPIVASWPRLGSRALDTVQ
jgi:hypothetical protein